MKVLIIGLGSIARKHISALKEIEPGVAITALRSTLNSKEVDGIKDIYDWAEIQEENPDFIIISNPTSFHYDTLKKIGSSKIPLFIEKPLFDKAGLETDILEQEITQKGTPTYVACNLRFLDSLKKIKEIVTKETVNEVNVYCGSYLPDWRPGVDYKTVYSANKEMGGGVHIDLIHELDYLYWIFGIPLNTNSFFRNRSSLCITAYDYANYIWEYTGFSVSVILNYYRRDLKRTFEIVCDSGTFLVDLFKNTISFNEVIIFESKQKTIDTYIEQMSYFIDSVLKKNKSFNTISDANKVLNLCIKD